MTPNAFHKIQHNEGRLWEPADQCGANSKLAYVTYVNSRI